VIRFIVCTSEKVDFQLEKREQGRNLAKKMRFPVGDLLELTFDERIVRQLPIPAAPDLETELA